MKHTLIGMGFLAAVFSLPISLLVCSCTYNISMAHTQGMADDVIDDNQSNTPNVSPNLSLPIPSLAAAKVDK